MDDMFVNVYILDKERKQRKANRKLLNSTLEFVVECSRVSGLVSIYKVELLNENRISLQHEDVVWP